LRSTIGAHEARDLETQRAGEAALQNYFEAVGELLIEKSLHRASPGDTLSAMVRAQTLSVLEGLDPNRKRILLSFLYESGLIYERKLVVSLALAKLNRANLYGANLLGANLRSVDLGNANLSRANLVGANLKGANLSNAYLVEVDLSGAHLKNVNLSNTYLIDANLRNANLSDADLSDADLSDADLSNALLSDANLSDSVLFNTNLSGTMGITSGELEQQARILNGAIMPDGSKHP
jgi:uncharacterized protein YjbI with pentapeptide repeats